MTLRRDAAYEAHIAAVVAAAPEAPREAIDLARRTLGPALRAYEARARAGPRPGAIPPANPDVSPRGPGKPSRR